VFRSYKSGRAAQVFNHRIVIVKRCSSLDTPAAGSRAAPAGDVRQWPITLSKLLNLRPV
jgi:hypothetical protein